MNDQEHIEKMLKKTESILRAGRVPKPKKLKPCPFCDNKHIYADTNCSRLDNMLEVKELQCSIVCRKCGARTAEFSDLAQAIKAWNRRAE